MSLIQSLYSRLRQRGRPAGTGFMLHNRGALFTLEEGHPNLLAPRKRPLHTIIPAFMEKGDVKIGFGIMGGFNQAQAHAQFVAGIVDYGLDVQQALEAGRFTKGTFYRLRRRDRSARARIGPPRAGGARSRVTSVPAAHRHIRLRTGGDERRHGRPLRRIRTATRRRRHPRSPSSLSALTSTRLAPLTVGRRDVQTRLTLARIDRISLASKGDERVDSQGTAGGNHARQTGHNEEHSRHGTEDPR